jgi:hypothetical protein
MTTIMFTPEEFRSVVSVGVAASTDDVTPIINAVQISVSETGEVTAVATDRYRIARVIFTPKMDGAVIGGEDSVTINAKELTKFWSGIKAVAMKSSHIPIVLDITADGDHKKYTLEYDGSRVESYAVRGSYPPVEKLMTGYDLDDCAGVPTVALKPSFLGDLAKMYHPRDDNRIKMSDIAWQFRFKVTESSKPGPVYITRGSDIVGATLDYLVQPNLLLR